MGFYVFYVCTTWSLHALKRLDMWLTKHKKQPLLELQTYRSKWGILLGFYFDLPPVGKFKVDIVHICEQIHINLHSQEIF